MSLIPQGIIWECSTDLGFVRYDANDTYNLEKAHLEGSSQVVTIRNDKYEVDLQDMKQKNLSTEYLRDVRRKVLCGLMVSSTLKCLFA